MKFHSGILVLVSALLIPAGLTGAQDEKPAGHGDRPHEGAISITGDGTLDWMTVLGGNLGNETVNGIDVGLFVLQAENPARLAPGAQGPTHVFNLTFLAAEESARTDGVVGTLRIDGPADEPLKVPFKPHESYYQATTRLEQEGEYRIRVVFATGDRSGETRGFPFHFRRKKPSAAGHRH